MLTHYPQANGLSNHCCVGHRAWVLKAQRSKSSRPVGSWGPPSWFLASGFIIILASLIMRCMSCLYVLDGRAKMRANITPKACLPSKTYLYINGHFSFPSLPNYLCSSSCCVEAQLEILISPRSLILNLQSSTLGPQLCKCGSHEIWKHCIFLAGMHWETPFLSFSSQKSQYMHFRDKVLDQLRLWGQAASCARLRSSSHLREKYFSDSK